MTSVTKTTAYVALFSTTIAVVSFICWNASSHIALKRIPTNELIASPGKYVLDGDRFLDISTTVAGTTSIAVCEYDGALLRKTAHAIFETGASVDDGWCVIADSYNRIWIYVGNSPSGRPKATVFLHGNSFDSNGNLCVVTEDVSITGNWEGVPQLLLSKIRIADSSLSKSVPVSAPELSADHRNQLAAALQTRR